MDLIFFENDIFFQFVNISLHKTVWNFFFKNLKIFSKTFSRIFQNILRIFPKKQSQKQEGVAHVILFAPTKQTLLNVLDTNQT
jgi:hypothetical protein